MDSERRRILRIIGKGSVVTAFLAQIGAAVRAFFPNVLYQPPSTFDLLPPADYPQGYTFDAAHRLFVVREANRFHIISAICTHLGCTVQYRGTEFDCPCHGSRFRLNGSVIAGPAPAPLPWYAASLSPGGLLQVDSAETVPAGSSLTAPVAKA
jgi:cytochrome b6-f complex iron-sulfur subunit